MFELLSIYRGHSDQVLGVAYSPDGTRLATASYDGTIHILDTTNNFVQVGSRSTAPNAPLCVTYNPQGTQLATGCVDGTVRIFYVKNNYEMITVNSHNDITSSVAYNHDGSQLATASYDRTVKVFDARDPTAAASGSESWPLIVGLTVGGVVLAVLAGLVLWKKNMPRAQVQKK
jgi:WD40 repeat protein